ncbi:MAG: metallophosphoesterase [Bacteroidota bacterium]
MPGTLYHPIHRRSFIKKSLTLAGVAATATPIYSYATAPSEEVHWAFLSDTHVAGDKEEAYRGFRPYENLQTIVPQVLEASPQGVIINGDVARLTGEQADYERINELLDPVAQQIPVHMTMGNHDDRENFYQVFTGNNTEVEDKYVQMIEASPVRMILLDSLLYVNKVAGLLGKSQRSWLKDYLTSASVMPTLLFVHHTLGDSDSDLLDVDRMFDIVQPHSSVKAVFYGHSHQYQYSEREGIHLINLPAVGYNFSDDQPVGWIDAKLTETGGDFTLRAFGGNQSNDKQTTHLDWR